MKRWNIPPLSALPSSKELVVPVAFDFDILVDMKSVRAVQARIVDIRF